MLSVMVLLPNCSKVGDNMLYLFFSRTLLSCCLSYCSQTTNFQNRPSCSVSDVTHECVPKPKSVEVLESHLLQA